MAVGLLPRIVATLLSGLVLCSPGCGDRTRADSAKVADGAVSAPVRPAAVANTARQPAEGPLELLFPFGSEKERWIEAVTGAFNDLNVRTRAGHTVRVRAVPMGSGEMVAAILEGRLQAHLASPASAVFVELGNAQSLAETGKPLLEHTQSLVVSPVIIAMWKPMAEALGWGKKPLGWADILPLVHSAEGWSKYGLPQWGAFKFGHTHPEFSNSGLLSVVAEAYAGVGKVKGLTLDDVQRLEDSRFLHEIETSIVHYGSSTGFFGHKLHANGPAYLSAAVLYENLVIEAYGAQHPLPFPLVAIYPKEGTFWSDHPVAVVERPWVTNEHREAANLYIKFLSEAPQQRRALQFGFRPADPSIPLGAPIDRDHGVDPNEPQTTLAVPSASVVKSLLQLWRKQKKHANIVLAIDTSGSMFGEELAAAQAGADELVNMLGDDDRISLLSFADAVKWSCKGVRLKEARAEVHKGVAALVANGGTALYDAVADAYRYLTVESPTPDLINAVVVLTDGADTTSERKLNDLFELIRRPVSGTGIRIFAIGYGRYANQSVLREITEATRAEAYTGSRENVRELFKKISTFF